MDKEKKDFLPLTQVKPRGERKRRVGYKPIFGGIVTVAFGLFALFLRGIAPKIMGGVVIALGLAVLFAIKSRRIMDVYTEGLLVYSRDDQSRAFFLPFKKISQWSVKRNPSGSQTVMLLLTEDKYVYFESFNLRSIRKTLLRYMPAKEFNGA